jgi:DNA repair exonuclease SbcCD ATPase subunit
LWHKGEIVQALKDEIAVKTEISFDKVLLSVVKDLETKILSEEENIRKNETLIGAAQNRLTYLKDIENLLKSVIDGTVNKADVPCPVCKRPIDKALADRLIKETGNQIGGAEKELSEVKKVSISLQTEIGDLKGKMQKIREYDTRLNSFPNAILEKAVPLTINRIDQLWSSVNAFLEVKADEMKKIISAVEAVKNESYLKTQELANMRAEIGQMDRISLLRNRLCVAHGELMIAETLTEVLGSLLYEQRDRKLTQVYSLISHLWNKFRPESEWQIVLDDKGIIRVTSKDRQYGFSHLSGGEKTVLLVLIRVILCSLLATKIDFIMIDEPLEHLDISNRRSLLSFLVGACRKNVIPQMLVTTFEETLIRKYYEGEKTRTEFLA